MDKIPIIPADPMEAAQMPIEGVDVPENYISPHRREKSGQLAENEGLVTQKARKAAGAVERADGQELDAATEAAQRGRTA